MVHYTIFDKGSQANKRLFLLRGTGKPLAGYAANEKLLKSSFIV